MNIIVDAFGGDNAPLEIIKGCVEAVAEYNINVTLTGDETKIKNVFSENSLSMNNIDICYDEDTKKYMLGVETVYCFNNRTQDECYYLKDLLIKFTKYMIDNNLEIDTDVHLNEMYIEKPMEANSISKLYTQFKIFVEGFCAVNGGNADE